MILKDNLYKIQSHQENKDNIVYEISLLLESDIYKAHFPNKPITPGVCIVQIVVELLSDYLNVDCKLSLAKNIKYLQVINPIEAPNITIELKKIMQNEKEVSLQVVVSRKELLFTKLSLQCAKM